MAHLLHLYLTEDESDTRVLRVRDISIYDPLVPITNVVLKINIPNNSCDFMPPFPLNGTGYYTSNTFGITKALCGADLTSLPDGLYTITYSVCPNEEVFTIQRIFRTTVTECYIYAQLSNILKGGKCNNVYDGYGNEITDERITDLKDLLLLLETAKSDVKIGKYSQANDKLEYVNKKLIYFSKNSQIK